MTERDNTNTAVAFEPHSGFQLILQGRMNVDGAEAPIVIIKQPVGKEGKSCLVLYRKAGVLFPNDKHDNDRAPDYTGPLEVPGPVRRIAAWKRESDKAGRFLSMKITLKDATGSPAIVDDGDVPF